MDGTSIVRVAELAGHMAQGQGALFVGAGISTTAGGPTWDKLVEPLRKRLVPPTQEVSPPLVAQFFRNQAGDHELFSHLRALLGNLQPSAVHKALTALPVRVIVTTNYDSLIETAFRLEGRHVHVIRDDHEIGLWNEAEEVQVLKLHGDIDSARSLVLTEQDYFRFMREHPAFKRKLVDLFCHRTVLFLGFSMRDPNVSMLYNVAVQELGEIKRQAYILTTDADVHLRRHWARQGLRMIPLQGATDAMRSAALVALLGKLKDEIDRASRGCDVLLVDDDGDVRDSLREVLADEGVRVQVAADGYEGLLLLAKFRPRLVLLDIMMPRMDGMGMLRRMRAHADFRDTEVVVVSAIGSDAHRAEAAQLGVRHWLQKPVSIGELLSVVRPITDAGGGRVPAPATDA
ncbi:MAG TPA: SIR2 family protein [Polyangiaceae bacterium]|nr:SIR2 family protein [Polyangiaceae bacterium]